MTGGGGLPPFPLILAPAMHLCAIAIHVAVCALGLAFCAFLFSCVLAFGVLLICCSAAQLLPDGARRR
jgi:hypothetical protein